MFRRRPAMALGAVIAANLVSLPMRQAFAGNDDEILVGNSAAMSAGAVTATEQSGSSLYYNPAGLVEVDENTIDASGSAYGIRHYDTDGLVADRAGRTGDGALTELLLVASAVSYVRPLGDNIRGGVGLFVTRWTDFSLRSRLITDEQESIMTVADRQQIINGIAGVGFAPLPGLRFGATLHIIYLTGETSFQFGGGKKDDLNDVNVTLSSLSSSSGAGIRLGAGVQYDILPELVVGLAVTSPSARIFSSTSVDTLTNVNIGLFRSFEADFEEATAFDWQWEQPARIRLGLAYRFWEQGWISADADVQPPLRNDSLDVDRSTTWNVRIGAHVPVVQDWSLGAGLFTDRGPENASRRGDFYGGTVGVRYRSHRDLDEEEDVDTLNFETVAALRYAHAATLSEGFLVDFASDDPEQLVTQRSIGIDVHELSLHIGGGVRF